MPDSAIMQQVSSRELALSTAQVMADIIRLLVHRPDQVTLKARSCGNTVTLYLQVAPADVGKVVGKQGRTARSLRTVLGSISSKTGLRFDLDIHEERS